MGLFERGPSNTPVAALLIGARNEESLSQDLGLAALGDFLAGGIGALAGLALAPGIDYATFLVTFADGHQCPTEVRVGDKLFKRYMGLPRPTDLRCLPHGRYR